MIVVLSMVNIVLAMLFVAILVGGSYTDLFARYVTERKLNASPIAALLVLLYPFLWEGIKSMMKPHLPNAKEQRKLFRATLDRIRKLARPWPLATLVITILAVLVGTQMSAVDHVCSPAPEQPGPHGSDGIALSIDERLLYLSDETNGVAVFDASPNAMNIIGPAYSKIDTIQGIDSPQGFARTPDGRHLYVVSMGKSKKREVSVIDMSSNAVVNRLPAHENSRWIVSSPKGDRIYVSNVYFNQAGPRRGSISIIDTAQQATANNEITDLNCPEGLALSPDGGRLYVASQCGDGHDPLFVIDTSDYHRIAEIPGLAVGNAVTLSKDGRKAYVTRADFEWHDSITGTKGSPLSIVDTVANRIIKTIILQRSTSGLALTPDGKYVLATNGYQLSVIDTQTDELVNNLSLRGYGNAIVVRSDGMVIVSVSDVRRFVAFPLTKALSRWPCASI
jgi:DNA-binding beta-propeller fold protein YncE